LHSTARRHRLAVYDSPYCQAAPVRRSAEEGQGRHCAGAIGPAPVRLEDYVEDGHYVVRAEVPGIDPEKDLEVTVSGRMLGIRAERHVQTKTKQH
jgi:HSP20 family molecular chaperone IbpA